MAAHPIAFASISLPLSPSERQSAVSWALRQPITAQKHTQSKKGGAALTAPSMLCRRLCRQTDRVIETHTHTRKRWTFILLIKAQRTILSVFNQHTHSHTDLGSEVKWDGEFKMLLCKLNVCGLKDNTVSALWGPQTCQRVNITDSPPPFALHLINTQQVMSLGHISSSYLLPLSPGRTRQHVFVFLPQVKHICFFHLQQVSWLFCRLLLEVGIIGHPIIHHYHDMMILRFFTFCDMLSIAITYIIISHLFQLQIMSSKLVQHSNTHWHLT